MTDQPRKKITPPSPFVRALRSLVTDHRSAFAVVCAIIGISVGAVAVLFQVLITGWTWVMTGYRHYGQTGGAPHGIFGWHPLFVICTPAISGLLAGIFINRFSPFARGHGVPEVMLAVRRKGGVIPGRVALLKLLGTPLAIGGGGPVGKEGPIVQVGASIGSFLGTKLKLSTRQLTLLAGAGAAAGIAATFNTPLAGAVFALEVILVSFTAETIGMVTMAAVFGAVVAHEFLGDLHVVEIPEVGLTDNMDLWWVVVVALFAALGGLLFSRSIFIIDDFFSLLYHGPNWARPAVGGLLVGIGLYFVPQMYGDVTATLHGIITGDYSVPTLVVFFAAQVVFASLVISSGGSGGVFGPTLFVGATVGAIIGAFIAPLAQSSITTFAVIGMGAAFGAAARAPLTAVLIILEMTGQYSLILPMMLAVGLATGLS
ncbi:MAG: chloride channel protein, partial [Bowdeniella nasicola]|nr:chloride channel protein [Bowdeniella nasicola]